MAIIYTYPTKATLATSDLILISDSADGNKTKNATVASIKDAIDVVDSLTAGSGISLSGSTLPTGDITIANTGVLSISSANTALTTSGSSAITLTSISYGGGSTIGHVPVGGTAGNYLDGAGTWSTIDLTTDVNGVLPAENGGLGGGVFNNGDLVYYTGSSFARLATNGVTDGFVVTAASGVPTWAAAAGGGSGPGTGTQYSLPIWSTTSTLGDSLVTQNSGATVVNIGTSIASFSTVAGTGSVFATRLAINGYSTFGGKLQLNSADGGTSVTLQGPPNSGTTYDLQLPNAVGTANQVLKLPATPGSTNQLVWGDATGGSTYTLQAEAKSGTSVPLKLDASSGTDSTVNLKEGTNITLTRNSSSEITIASTSGGGGISPFPIYQAKDSVAVGAQTIIRQSVCETAGTYSKLEYFSIGATSYPVYFAIYAGTITAAGSAVKRLEGFNSTQAAGINVINFTGSYNFTAGQDIVIVVSANDTVGLAGSNTLLNHVDISRGSAVYTSSFPSSLSSLLDSIPNSVATGVCTHIY